MRSDGYNVSAMVPVVFYNECSVAWYTPHAPLPTGAVFPLCYAAAALASYDDHLLLHCVDGEAVIYVRY
jgi:hypothetical protein